MADDSQTKSCVGVTQNQDDEQDHDVFLQAMEDVIPLSKRQHDASASERKVELPESTLEFRRRQASSEQAVPEQALMPLSCHDVESVAPEADIHFCHPSVSPAVFKSLRKGLLPVEYNVDFHGCTIEEASKTLVQFVNYCHDNQFRCVRIIHGKSHKNYSRYWSDFKKLCGTLVNTVTRSVGLCLLYSPRRWAGCCLCIIKAQKIMHGCEGWQCGTCV